MSSPRDLFVNLGLNPVFSLDYSQICFFALQEPTYLEGQLQF